MPAARGTRGWLAVGRRTPHKVRVAALIAVVAALGCLITQRPERTKVPPCTGRKKRPISWATMRAAEVVPRGGYRQIGNDRVPSP